jgi:hypothetical protein
MRQRLTAISAATLLVLSTAACSGDDDGEQPRAATPPSALAELTEDPAAASAVKDALDVLRASNAGTFTARLEYDEITYDYYGSYRVDPAQHRISVTAGPPDELVTTEAVGDGGEFYVRLPPDGPVSSPCWVTGDPERVAEVTGFVTNPDFNWLPGALGLAATAVGVAYPQDSPPGEVLGSVDLATATGLISPRLPALLGIVKGDERVLARLSLRDGVLVGVRVDGEAILAALAQVGTDADPEELARVFGADAPVQVTLADAGADVVIQPPDPSAVIDLGRPDADRRLAECDE